MLQKNLAYLGIMPGLAILLTNDLLRRIAVPSKMRYNHLAEMLTSAYPPNDDYSI